MKYLTQCFAHIHISPVLAYNPLVRKTNKSLCITNDIQPHFSNNPFSTSYIIMTHMPIYGKKIVCFNDRDPRMVLFRSMIYTILQSSQRPQKITLTLKTIFHGKWCPLLSWNQLGHRHSNFQFEMSNNSCLFGKNRYCGQINLEQDLSKIWFKLIY